MRRTRVRRTRVGRIGAALAVAALVGVLAACQPIVVGSEGLRSSAASRAVDPVTVRVGGRNVAGIDIRMRDCQEAHLERDGQAPIVIGLTPRAHVVDARGTVFFTNPAIGPGVRPAGVSEQTREQSADGAHHIVVPVGGAVMPLTISFRCDSYTPGSHGLFPRWIFPTCRTNTRTCNATAPGTGEWYLTA